MIYPIVIYGAPALRERCEEVPENFPDLKKLTEDMFATMYEAEGVGLAAPQIGKNLRLFVVDCSPWADEDPRLKDFRKAFVNPEIYERSEQEDLFNEGCLSLPGLHEDVSRPVAVRIRYMDENFEQHDEPFDGYAARVIQHEYDHLDGKVFTDRLTPLRRNLIRSKLLNFTKGKFRASYRTRLK